MEIGVFNTISGEKWMQPLAGKEVLIGRNPPVHQGSEQDAPLVHGLVLRSNFISETQARLQLADGAWVVQHVGKNTTLLNNEPMQAERLYPLREADQIRVGEYLLSVVVTAKKAELPGAESTESLLMKLEKEIHAELLDAMKLRAGSGAIDLSKADVREKILSQLDRLAKARIDGLNGKQIGGLVKLYTYRILNRQAMAAGGGQRKDGAASFMELDESTHMGQVRSVVKRMAVELELSMEAKTLEQDNRRINERFDDMYALYELDFAPGVLRSAAADFVKRNILDLIFGLGPIQDLMEMNCISEVMVVCRDKIFIEKFGVVEDSGRAFFSDSILLAVIDRIVAPVNRRIDKSSPMVDAHLPDGSRVNAIIPPLALKGPCVTIRKFSKTPLSIADLVEFGALTAAVADFLRASVNGHKNIIVSGGTGSGKTTLLNALSAFIPRKERIVTIEDTAELQLQQEHVVTLESRPPNLEGKGEVTIRDLVKNALRMRPDRIVVGECRGAEALDMLQAMNTGHDGSMTTGHANSPADMMRRLETMVLMGTDMPVSAIREQIISAVDLVVQLNRFTDGRRAVTSVAEIVGIDEDTGQVLTEDIFRFERHAEAGDPGTILHTGYIPSFTEDFLQLGLMELDTFFDSEHRRS